MEHFEKLIDTNKTIAEWEVFKNTTGTSRDSESTTTWKLGTMDPRQAMTTLVENDGLSNVFPNLAKLALIALLIPSSTADCERGFSALKRIKTSLRNRLSNAITVQLLFISIEGPSPDCFDFDIACDTWAAKKNRRILI